jgi:hypothetical protein
MSQRTMDHHFSGSATHRPHDEDWREVLVDHEIERRWRRGRPRRIAVKVLGWLSILGALAGAVHIAESAGARAAILEWGTLSIMGGGR